ncbi:PAS domain-containing protein [Opacimonas viscosa]|uniref:PAS domain-containing protein n=1 Tax=Opacimonas viscosa TaxID=2961944 RepID=A0AA42BKF5_9ALTE|nr:PAS domain-containing protein [Opacimonas viscosa]MCP3427718.1 PAS domain-containing protein [Opacimonas viscosa]
MSQNSEMLQMHWLMDMVQSVDVGIVVLDRECKIHVWNDFMESHSGLLANTVKNQTLFAVNNDIDKEWFIQKTKPVFDLKVRTFITWEQRPYLFKFPNYRPITGTEDFMYQNVVISALTSATGAVDYISVMIYDTTDKAIAKKQLEALQVHMTENALPVR